MELKGIKLKKELIEKNKMLIGGVAIALVFVWFGYNNIFKSNMASLQLVKKEILDENTKTEELTKLGGIQASMQSYKEYFSDQRDISWLIDKVSVAANTSGLDVISLSPQPNVSSSVSVYYAVDISARGTFHQLGDFVSAIEGSKEFIKLENLSFKKTDKTLTAEMVISTYFFEKL